MPPDTFTPVAAEYRGQARTLIARLTADAETWMPAVNTIRHSAIAIANKRGKIIPPEAMKQTERAWRALPTVSQLSFTCHRKLSELMILDARVARETLTKPDWDEDKQEAAVIIAVWSLLMTRRRAVMETAVIATVSLHCLARRYERDGNVTDNTIIREMTEIARKAPRLVEGEGPFDIPVGAGTYSGKVAGFLDPTKSRHFAAHCRTFL